MPSILKETQRLCNKLQEITRIEKDVKVASQNCLTEIELAEIIISAKYKTTPLVTRLTFKNILRKVLPKEIENILEEGGFYNVY